MRELCIRLYGAMLRAEDKIVSLVKDERGDTNFISILIVLGIVIGLVVIFRGYIADILDTVKEQIEQF